MSWWSSLSIRQRLTIWYAGTLVAILLIFGVGVTAAVWRTLSRDLDQRLLDDFEAVETILEQTPADQVRNLGPLHGHDRSEEEFQIWAEAWTPHGELVYRGDMPEWLAAGLPAVQTGSPAIKRLRLPGGQRVRYLEESFSAGGLPVVVRVIRSEIRMRQTIGRLALIELAALPFIAILAAFVGHALAQQLLVPVTVMTQQARTITADRLHERLPILNPDDEMGNLAEVFNTTFSRLELSFDRLRQFTSDASHELRTPLTSIRSVGEVALRDHRDEPAYRETIGSMLEEVDRLSKLVDSLLTLSRADGGRFQLRPEPIDLADFAQGVVNDLIILAEEKGQQVSVESSGNARICADRQVLRHALVNLLDNAIKYSPHGSDIRVVVAGTPSEGSVEVIDEGPGIAPEDRERVFERFYRVEQSRSRDGGGSGLGLSITRWAVEAHGGEIRIEDREGRGCAFRVTLPNCDST